MISWGEPEVEETVNDVDLAVQALSRHLNALHKLYTVLAGDQFVRDAQAVSTPPTQLDLFPETQ